MRTQSKDAVGYFIVLLSPMAVRFETTQLSLLNVVSGEEGWRRQAGNWGCTVIMCLA